MGSKVIVFLGLLLVTIFLMISSEAAARELAETSNTVDTSNVDAEKTNNGAAVNDAKYPGGGYGGYPGADMEAIREEDMGISRWWIRRIPRGGYGGYPGRGGYGGGYPGRGGYGGGYPGRGGYCRYGCCGRSYYGGGGCRCCSYAGEKVDADVQDKPQN
ncbi:hypothetical protein DH2020_047304 [Rehmannia glutinosa]|uniref:Glycine-rich protein n=1 Tax=Rehmannia glutinosa TaxID=99300 RepID=A0ABR0U9G2_REHGL